MIININPDWRMCWRERNWVVEKRFEVVSGGRGRKDANGAPAAPDKVEWRAQSYHGTPESAITYFARYSIYPIPGTYEFEALDALIKTMDGVRADAKAAMAEWGSSKGP
jgi:hypothetical protein